MKLSSWLALPILSVSQLPLPAAETPPPAASAASASQPEAERVTMSVFEVTAQQDRGYAASSAMSGTQTNEKLENLPNSISVMNADFLADIAALDFFDAADFAVGAENVYNDQGTQGAAIGTRSGKQRRASLASRL